MIILRISQYSVNNQFQLGKNITRTKQSTLNTSGGFLGFNRNRHYDQDFNRLGKNETTRQLTQTRELQQEMRKLSSELNKGRRGEWLDT